MKIAIGSAFRNSVARLPSYFGQVARLRNALIEVDHTLAVIAVHGDSDDNTAHGLWAMAQRASLDLQLVERSHRGPVFGSTESPVRMKALQYVGNGILESVTPDVDILIYVESDLLWTAETMLNLIARLSPEIDVVAPLVFAGEAFYDIFAFRRRGVRFGPFAPFHPDFAEHDELMEIDSAGSCLVMKGHVARRCRIGEAEGLVSFCADAKAQGFRLWADQKNRILHPA